MLIALTFATALVVGLIATPVIRRLAHRLDVLDEPDARKIHVVALPRLGGVAMIMAFAAATGFALLALPDLGATDGLRPNRALPMVTGVVLILAIGLVDDIGGMRALVKLALQVGVATVVFVMGLQLDTLHFPWGYVGLGAFAYPITVAWIVGMINAINLIDGLDGLASGVVLTVLGAFAVLAASDRVEPMLPLIAATAGAAVGFLAYNLHPASIIMGDTGSMFLGFIVGAVGISLMRDGAQPVAPWVPVIAVGLPIADTVWAVVRRTARGAQFFVADRGHIHHQLLDRGLSQRDAMLILTAVSAGLAVLAIVVGRGI
jgi:UDP-GlcNAc:undecaprenyl-phosphate GlcNAc-1-phosphate transferase